MQRNTVGFAAAGCVILAYTIPALVRAVQAGDFLAALAHGAAVTVAAAAMAILAVAIRRPAAAARAPLTGEIPGYLDTLRILAAAIDAADPFTRGRSYRVSRFCVRIGSRLGMRGQELRDLEYAALLHDLGRTAIENDLYLKPGKLSAEEQATMQTHPQIAYEILKDIPPLAAAAELVRAHHEQPDGRGYPRQLAAEAIPLGSRIIMAVAAFEALTSERPYRRGLSPAEAYGKLRANRGTMFFPEVIDTLIDLHASGALFDDFDREEIAKYEGRDYASRALEGHLKTAA